MKSIKTHKKNSTNGFDTFLNGHEIIVPSFGYCGTMDIVNPNDEDNHIELKFHAGNQWFDVLESTFEMTDGQREQIEKIAMDYHNDNHYNQTA